MLSTGGGSEKGPDAEVSVRLLDKRSGQPVADAVIFTTRMDVAPEGMTPPVEELPSAQPGTYKFKTNPSVKGGWRFQHGAKVQGEGETVQGEVVVKATHNATCFRIPGQNGRIQGPDLCVLRAWSKAMADADFNVVVRDEDFMAIKAKLGILDNMQGCHTAVVGDYFFEGWPRQRFLNRRLRLRIADIVADGSNWTSMPWAEAAAYSGAHGHEFLVEGIRRIGHHFFIPSNSERVVNVEGIARRLRMILSKPKTAREKAMTAAEKRPDLEHDAVEQVIAWHAGDMKAAIATLIDDCRHLRDQLDTAQKCMSKGLTRGWVPSPER